MNHTSVSSLRYSGGINMDNKTFELATKVINNEFSIEKEAGKQQVPYYFRRTVKDIVDHYNENDSEYFKKARDIAIFKTGAMFAKKRDEIRWVNGYGFDCANEDITNFLASYIKLKDDYTQWVANGSQGNEPATYYKVYVDPETMAKTVVPLTLTAFNQVYEVVRTSQFGAYAWLETVRAAINNTHNFTDLAQVLETYEITL